LGPSRSILRQSGKEVIAMVDETRCIAKVADDTGWHFYQCSRKRGYGKDGKYCKQHAKRYPSRDNKEVGSK